MSGTSGISELIDKLVGKTIVVGDILDGKLVFTVIENYQYKKKYSKIYCCDIFEIEKYDIKKYDYFIFFKNYDNYEWKKYIEIIKNKILFIDEICKFVIRAPFDLTFNDLVVNLDTLYDYIFGYNYYLEIDTYKIVIIKLLKILKYLYKNTSSKPEINELMIYDKTDKINIVSFNVFTSNYDLKKGETIRQINYLTNFCPDIMFLQECSNNLHDYFINYYYLKTPSHCGYTYLLINDKLKPEIIDSICDNGIIVVYIKTILGYMILGSLHMIPHDDYENCLIRIEQIEMLKDWIIINKLDKYSIIIGGDTNMTDYESEMIKKNNFFDELSNYSYPNRDIIYKNAKKYATNIKNNYKYDKFLTKNIDIYNFQTLNTYDSDHFLNILSIDNLK